MTVTINGAVAGGASSSGVTGFISSINALPSTAGLVEQVTDDVAAIRLIGVTNDTDIPTYANVRGQFVKVLATGTPSGGANGDTVLTLEEPYAGYIWTRAAGTWSTSTPNTGTFAEMLAVASPSTGMEWFVDSINLGGSLTTYPLNQWFRYNGTSWYPRNNFSLWRNTAVSSTVTSTVTSFLNCQSLTVPTGLFQAGMSAEIVIRAVNLAGTSNWRPRCQFNSTDIINAGDLSNAAAPSYFRGRGAGKCLASNVVTFTSGGTVSWAESNTLDVSTAPVSVTFDGSTAFNFGFTFATADSTTTARYEEIDFRVIV